MYHVDIFFRIKTKPLVFMFLRSFIYLFHVDILINADIGAESISNFIYSYATSVPNLAVRNFHEYYW